MMKGFASSVLLMAFVLALFSQSAHADATTMTAQFDNRAARINGAKKPAIIAAVAAIFGVPVKQVELLSVLDQSGIRAQSIATFKITGPSSLKKPMLEICQSVISAFPGFDSKFENDLEKATDSWLPADKIEFEKGTCT